MSWNNFNTSDDQTVFDLIPKGTLVKMHMSIKPGVHDSVKDTVLIAITPKHEQYDASFMFVFSSKPYALAKPQGTSSNLSSWA